MRFINPTVFIDPSYSCSGVCLVDSNQKILEFQGFSASETKRDLEKYYNAARSIASSFSSWLKLRLEQYPNLDVVMEAPFPGSFASSGLFLLQGLMLKEIQENLKSENRFYSLTPSYISNQIKKACSKQDGIGVRKRWANDLILNLESQGWRIKNSTLLKAAGCDPQTALGFWWFLSNSEKTLEPFAFVDLEK